MWSNYYIWTKQLSLWKYRVKMFFLTTKKNRKKKKILINNNIYSVDCKFNAYQPNRFQEVSVQYLYNDMILNLLETTLHPSNFEYLGKFYSNLEVWSIYFLFAHINVPFLGQKVAWLFKECWRDNQLPGVDLESM